MENDKRKFITIKLEIDQFSEKILKKISKKKTNNKEYKTSKQMN